jgi:hypothetical protein
MSDLSLFWTAAAVATFGIVVAAFAFFRWLSERTNRALGNALFYLAIGVNAAATAASYSGSRSSHGIAGALLALNIVFLGTALYFMFRKGKARPTA